MGMGRFRPTLPMYEDSEFLVQAKSKAAEIQIQLMLAQALLHERATTSRIGASTDATKDGIKSKKQLTWCYSSCLLHATESTEEG